MNKIFKWFYEREKFKRMKEVDMIGLQIVDKEVFERHILKMSKRSMLYSAVFWILIIVIIYSWVIK